jgi:hypothetical protein
MVPRPDYVRLTRIVHRWVTFGFKMEKSDSSALQISSSSLRIENKLPMTLLCKQLLLHWAAQYHLKMHIF